MSQHKYNDAYNKGFEDGKKKAFDDWVYQCYDELSPKEQIELLLSEGAELPRKAILKALENVRAEIEDIDGITEIGAQILDEVSGIIDQKIKEIKHECSSCTHSDEVDGEHCYECVKCDRDNFEANTGEELTNPFGDNSKIFWG